MTILSRKPSANEKEVWLKAQDSGLTPWRTSCSPC
jgi:hypothetical protein